MSGMEIVTRRRKWTAEEKAELLAEIEAEGGRVSVVARRHGISDSLLYNWRSAWKAAMAIRAPELVEFMPLGLVGQSREEDPGVLAAAERSAPLILPRQTAGSCSRRSAGPPSRQRHPAQTMRRQSLASAPPAIADCAADPSWSCPQPNSWTLSILKSTQIRTASSKSAPIGRRRPAEGNLAPMQTPMFAPQRNHTRSGETVEDVPGRMDTSSPTKSQIASTRFGANRLVPHRSTA
jgi:transposase-like protein